MSSTSTAFVAEPENQTPAEDFDHLELEDIKTGKPNHEAFKYFLSILQEFEWELVVISADFEQFRLDSELINECTCACMAASQRR